jgi:hypothetical protein
LFLATGAGAPKVRVLLETATTHVLILWYDCPQVLPDDPPRRFCSDSGEWSRDVAMDGSLLDRGFGLGLGLGLASGDSDPREAALRARLGLPPDHEALTFWSLRWPSDSAGKEPNLRPR